MRAPRQTTISAPCSLSGRGYWSGKANTLTFVPAPAGCGIQFQREDLPGEPVIAATADHRVSMPLRTRLSRQIDGMRVEFDMIEHVMSALYGLGIDNVTVRCTSSEIPGFDGSSHPIALCLNSVGTVEQNIPRRQTVVRRPFQVGDDDRFVRVEPINTPEFGNPNVCNPKASNTNADAAGLQIEYQLDYGLDHVIGRSTYRFNLDAQTYFREVAPARTFISEADASALQERGIAMHVTERDLLVFGESGPINNCLRYPDECARHKALDLLGDLALAGTHLVGRVTAYRSGHQLNGEMAAHLRSLQDSTNTESECGSDPIRQQRWAA